MEDIISKLAEIEAAASHIMEDVSEQKKELAQQYDQAMRDFDQAVDDEIMAKNREIRDELEIEERHAELAKQVYDRILRM